MNLPKNPYLLFLPFLLFFIGFIIIFHTDAIEADEGRYLMFADNLIHGFYSPPAPNINLWNGPGYPIILMPFVGLRLPLISITLLNAFFYYLSIVFLFKALLLIVPFRKALVFSLFWGCYFNAYQKIARINSETFTLLLVALIAFSLLKAFSEKSDKYVFLSGFLIGAIALTKIVFGYVLLAMLLIGLLSWFWNRDKSGLKRGAAILSLALVVAAPYLVYTYRLTGRVFYWGNSGGATLYWMSTPYPGEYGDYWHGKPPEPHRQRLAAIAGKIGIEQDDAMKKIALENIKAHPAKYAENWIANLGRLFFNFPYSKGSDAYRSVGSPMRSLALLPLNIIVFLLMLYGFFKTISKWKSSDHSIRFLFCFFILYLGASSLVSAYSRQFYVVVPVLLVIGAYVENRREARGDGL